MSDFVDNYINTLKLIPAKDWSELENNLLLLAGENKTRQILKIIEGRYDGDADQEIYKLMNSDLDFSVSFVGLFDGNFLKKLFNKLEKHRSYFGKTILDIGCNNGIITCFIASLCPDSQVLGVDLLEDGISIAKELSHKLGLTNIVFDAMDFSLMREQYETVFSSKLSHEYLGESINNVDWESPKEHILFQFEKIFKLYVSQIRKLLKPEGSFITIDRIASNIGIYGFYNALNKQQISPDMTTFSWIKYLSIGESERIPFLCCKNGKQCKNEIAEVFERFLQQELEEWQRSL